MCHELPLASCEGILTGAFCLDLLAWPKLEAFKRVSCARTATRATVTRAGPQKHPVQTTPGECCDDQTVAPSSTSPHLLELSSAAQILRSVEDVGNRFHFQQPSCSTYGAFDGHPHAGHPTACHASLPRLPAHICREP